MVVGQSQCQKGVEEFHLYAPGAYHLDSREGNCLGWTRGGTLTFS